MDFKNDIRFRGIRPFDKKIWLSSPTIHGEEQRWVDEAIRTNWVSTIGANINEIEKNIAQYVGCRYAVALSSGTAALHVATKLAGEKLYGMARPDHGTLEGKKVFCSDVTFSASINPVAYEDGEAVFIDTEPDTWNMSPEALEKAFQIYPEVRLIVVAHLYGTPGKVAEIRRIADAHGALIVEDAAESLGARYFLPVDLCTERDGRAEAGNVNGVDGWWVETGALGDYNCISFNGNKIITGSSGGMFLTDSLEDCNKVKKWSTQSREDAPWYQHEEIGYNYRMSNIVAGIVRGQLPYLDMHIDQKREIYERYKAGFKGLPVTMNPFDASVSDPNYWLSCLLIKPEAMAPHVRGEKDQLWQHVPGKSSPGEILAALAAFNAEGRPVWKPMHMQPIYRTNPFITAEGNGRARSNAYISGKGQDVGEDLYRRGLCLPSDNKMTAEQQEVVIEVVRRCFARA